MKMYSTGPGGAWTLIHTHTNQENERRRNKEKKKIEKLENTKQMTQIVENENCVYTRNEKRKNKLRLKAIKNMK